MVKIAKFFKGLNRIIIYFKILFGVDIYFWYNLDMISYFFDIIAGNRKGLPVIIILCKFRVL